MMAVLRMHYVHSFVDKTDRVRYYFRYSGKRWPLTGEPGSAEFAQSYDDARRQAVPVTPGSTVTFAPATLGYVIEKYAAARSSPAGDLIAEAGLSVQPKAAKPTPR